MPDAEQALRDLIVFTVEGQPVEGVSYERIGNIGNKTFGDVQEEQRTEGGDSGHDLTVGQRRNEGADGDEQSAVQQKPDHAANDDRKADRRKDQGVDGVNNGG